MTAPKYFSKLNSLMKGAVSLADVIQYDGPVSVGVGHPALDWALGGGFAIGRMNLLAGPKGSLKSTFATIAAGRLQQNDPESVVIIKDTEGYYHNNPIAASRLVKMGLDPERTIIHSSNEPDVIFKSLAEEEALLKAGEIKIAAYIIDSLGGLSQKHTEDSIKKGEISSAGNKFGGDAKVIGALCKVFVRMGMLGPTFFLVQHAYQNMENPYDPWVISGGQKLQYLVRSMVLLETVQRKDAALMSDGENSEDSKSKVKVGKLIRAKILKTGFCVEGRVGEAYMDLNGCSPALVGDALAKIAKEVGVLVPAGGAWFTYGDKKYNGVGKFGEALEASKSLYDDVYGRVIQDTTTVTAGPDINFKLGNESIE